MFIAEINKSASNVRPVTDGNNSSPRLAPPIVEIHPMRSDGSNHSQRIHNTNEESLVSLDRSWICKYSGTSIYRSGSRMADVAVIHEWWI